MFKLSKEISEEYKVVLSGKSLQFNLKLRGKSLIKTRKNNGSSTYPWGTLSFKLQGFEIKGLTLKPEIY